MIARSIVYSLVSYTLIYIICIYIYIYIHILLNFQNSGLFHELAIVNYLYRNVYCAMSI